MLRRDLLGACAMALLATPALAGTQAETGPRWWQPFRQSDFDAAQAADRPIVVEINAGWCPTCARQRPILSQLMQTADLRTLTVFRVDFDSQKPVVRELGANMQGTLIAYRGKQEVGRSVGDTRQASIAALLHKAVA